MLRFVSSISMRRSAFLLAALLPFLPVTGRGLNVVINSQNTTCPASRVYFSFRDARCATS